jgi:hypothetical protein
MAKLSNVLSTVLLANVIFHTLTALPTSRAPRVSDTMMSSPGTCRPKSSDSMPLEGHCSSAVSGLTGLASKSKGFGDAFDNFVDGACFLISLVCNMIVCSSDCGIETQQLGKAKTNYYTHFTGPWVIDVRAVFKWELKTLSFLSYSHQLDPFFVSICRRKHPHDGHKYAADALRPEKVSFTVCIGWAYVCKTLISCLDLSAGFVSLVRHDIPCVHQYVVSNAFLIFVVV